MEGLKIAIVSSFKNNADDQENVTTNLTKFDRADKQTEQGTILFESNHDEDVKNILLLTSNIGVSNDVLTVVLNKKLNDGRSITNKQQDKEDDGERHIREILSLSMFCINY